MNGYRFMFWCLCPLVYLSLSDAIFLHNFIPHPLCPPAHPGSQCGSNTLSGTLFLHCRQVQ